MSIKFLVLGGGDFDFLGGGGGDCRFYFYGRGDSSEPNPGRSRRVNYPPIITN